MRRFSLLCFVVACRLHFDSIDDRDDAGVAVCAAAGLSCAGDAVRQCAAAGAPAVDQACAWGCVATGGAHCGQLDPLVIAPEVITAPSGPLADLELANAWITADGGIAVDGGLTPIRYPIAGEQMGIEFYDRGGVGVYRVHSLHVAGRVYLAQHDWYAAVQPIAIVAAGPIVIDALIDGESVCTTDDQAAPGGYPGNLGTNPSGHMPAMPPNGGGGGGNGGVGGASNATAGGSAEGAIALIGGGGGGGGGTSSLHVGVGGAGGAALQLVSSTSIAIGAAGGINAGGCGGITGDFTHGGGGGGAGGTLVLEAPTIEIAGRLAVNGGAGAGNTAGNTAQNGRLARVAATGAGGAGGFAGSPNGADAPAASAGGGGAIGRIRFETLHGDIVIDAGALLSPDPNDVLTTTTVGSAVVR